MPDPNAVGEMKVGIALSGINPKFRVAAAQTAEEVGFESVWLPEHLVFPISMSRSPTDGDAHPPMAPVTPAPDVLISLTAIAATTTRIRLGTNVYNIGLRHPFIVARAIATLDQISQGRVEFGIGSSWLEEEWTAMGLDFATRGRRVDETIEVCRRLWSEPVIEHHGTFFDFPPVAFYPKPHQEPYPPLLIGGDGPAARRRAALVGDAWFPLNHPVEALPAATRAINERRHTAGRNGHTTLTVSSGAEPRPDLGRYRDAGVDRLVMRPYTASRTAIDEIRRYGDEVLAGFRQSNQSHW